MLIAIPLQKGHPVESQQWSGLPLQNQFERPDNHRTPVRKHHLEHSESLTHNSNNSL